MYTKNIIKPIIIIGIIISKYLGLANGTNKHMTINVAIQDDNNENKYINISDIYLFLNKNIKIVNINNIITL